MVNKYAGDCSGCGSRVAKRAGVLSRVDGRWTVAHRECSGNAGSNGRATVSTVTRFSSGAVVYRNRNGICEDAPCCGCCTG